MGNDLSTVLLFALGIHDFIEFGEIFHDVRQSSYPFVKGFSFCIAMFLLLAFLVISKTKTSRPGD